MTSRTGPVFTITGALRSAMRLTKALPMSRWSQSRLTPMRARELGDDLFGDAPGREQGMPAADVEIPVAELCQRRHARQLRRAGRHQHGQGAKLAVPD